jgi:hypothetical protein
MMFHPIHVHFDQILNVSKEDEIDEYINTGDNHRYSEELFIPRPIAHKVQKFPTEIGSPRCQ